MSHPELRSLGYIGIGVTDIDRWRDYARSVLGLMVTEDGAGGLRLRADSRDWRIAVTPTAEDDITLVGWEVEGPAALAAWQARLAAHGVTVEAASPALLANRGVLGLISCRDPLGIANEFFWGPTERFETPFASPVGVSGFEMGSSGLGHVVLAAPQLDIAQAFYQDLLGFKFSDMIQMSPAPGISFPVFFYHCNPRHHTLAMAPVPNPQKLIHFMLQVRTLDDVGFAMDRNEAAGYKMSMGLGRHSNDHMVSFYSITPSGFDVEYGFGARDIDDVSWTPVRHDKISAWGHKRQASGNAA